MTLARALRRLNDHRTAMDEEDFQTESQTLKDILEQQNEKGERLTSEMAVAIYG